MLVVVVEDARNTINELQEDLITAKVTILDLTESLSESHAAREEASERAASILEHINRGEPKRAATRLSTTLKRKDSDETCSRHQKEAITSSIVTICFKVTVNIN